MLFGTESGGKGRQELKQAVSPEAEYSLLEEKVGQQYTVSQELAQQLGIESIADKEFNVERIKAMGDVPACIVIYRIKDDMRDQYEGIVFFNNDGKITVSPKVDKHMAEAQGKPAIMIRNSANSSGATSYP